MIEQSSVTLEDLYQQIISVQQGQLKIQAAHEDVLNRIAGLVNQLSEVTKQSACNDIELKGMLKSVDACWDVTRAQGKRIDEWDKEKETVKTQIILNAANGAIKAAKYILGILGAALAYWLGARGIPLPPQ